MTGARGWAFCRAGHLGIYGDFLYGINETRYGSGPLEALGGPTIGPLIELGLQQPLGALKKVSEGKEPFFFAHELRQAKGFVPFQNVWYLKAALEHMVWQRVLEIVSPGYLNTMRAKTAKEYGQDWWWTPGQTAPDRAPDLGAAMKRR